jgi:hypothetical protein
MEHALAEILVNELLLLLGSIKLRLFKRLRALGEVRLDIPNGELRNSADAVHGGGRTKVRSGNEVNTYKYAVK